MGETGEVTSSCSACGTVRSVRDARGRGEGTSQPPAPRERQDEARAPRGTRRPRPVPVALGRPAPPHSALPSALLRRPHLREHVVSFLPLSRHTCRSLGSPRPVERIPALSKIPALGRRRRASRRASQPGRRPACGTPSLRLASSSHFVGYSVRTFLSAVVHLLPGNGVPGRCQTPG